MGKAASTTWPATLCFGQLRLQLPFNGAGPLHTHKPVISPSYTLHAYVYEYQPVQGLGKTLCGKQMARKAVIPTGRVWLFRSGIEKTECAHCQRLQARWYGT